MAEHTSTLTMRQALNRVSKCARAGITDNKTVGYCSIRYARARLREPTVVWSGSKRTVEEQQAVIDASAARGCVPAEWCVVPVLVTRVRGGTEWRTGTGRAGGSYLARLLDGTTSTPIVG